MVKANIGDRVTYSKFAASGEGVITGEHSKDIWLIDGRQCYKDDIVAVVKPFVPDYQTELRYSRAVISELLDKVWDFGGNSVGEKEFEGYDFVKDARKQLDNIDKILNHGLTTKNG